MVGGGSLAAGGFGMAGGAMVIAGTGAVIGGAGVTSVSTLIMSQTSNYTLNESAKILTISKYILHNKNNAKRDISSLKKLVLKQLYDLRVMLDQVDNEKDEDFKLTEKNIKTSIKYLERCLELLEKDEKRIIA